MSRSAEAAKTAAASFVPPPSSEHFFSAESEAREAREARLRELRVLRAELGSLRPGARVFRAAGPGCVALQEGDVARVSSEVAREVDGLKKLGVGAKTSEKAELNF